MHENHLGTQSPVRSAFQSRRVLLRIPSNVAIGLLIFLSLPPLLTAQSPDPRKFEVALGYSLLRTSFLGRSDKTESGIAARVSYSLSDHISVEAELNLFPQNLEVFSKGMVVGLSVQR